MPAIAEHFVLVTQPESDTIRIAPGVDEDQQGHEISISDFYADLDTALLNRMTYPPDSTDMQAFGHWILPIDNNFDGYLLELRQNWFVFKYLLLFSKKDQKFTNLLPLAQFYGGDGGQIKMESWIFKQGNGGPKMLTRTSEHALVMQDDEMEDTYDERVLLLEWKQGSFQEITIPDSSLLIETYPIKW
ncbi:MAG: hypothetical protein DHS20C18_49430 [Saprospiraceae bacterium]|nr:MAG: hypothetical protein DHS20C18_49430 [Saprospiraceae bacterium]